MSRPIRALALLGAVAVAFACASARVERRWPVMGTFATAEIRASSEPAAARAVEEVRKTFDGVDRSMSVWRADSALSRINRDAGTRAVTVDDADLRRCLRIAFDAAERTSGAFDPTVGPLMKIWGFRPHAPRVPDEAEIEGALARVGWRRVRLPGGGASVQFEVDGMEIDLGGVAKGLALDLARERIESSDVSGALLDLGGNLLVFGRPPEGRSWRVGIRDPGSPDSIGATLSLREGAVSTSANTENFFEASGRRFGHLMDPTTGRPAETDVVVATAIAPDGATSDALSTALAVAGSARAPAILGAFPGTAAVLLVRRGDALELSLSQALAGRVEIAPSLARRLAGPPRYDLPPATLPIRSRSR